MTRLVIASGNAGKVREFGHLLAGLGLEIQPQPDGLEVEETGATFAENARLKASAVARASGAWALADDSGLSVDALGGAPGVHSARYADSDSARIARLLRELEQAQASSSNPSRQAHFAAALALADPNGTIRLEVEGRCPGVILKAPRGTGGFGYDPVFLVPEAGLTFAEMPSNLKAKLGHRGRAFAKLEPALRQLLGR
ncbi:RdgB/HAM1 family non-canonical purine NTP pyrophosphatase [Cyanobium sp. Alchichica 3B3-8F6]|uniref:RdgB/HAM1 family non-canonical purine NTP pyrophosphatase n=1 Tax=Cyanobium sp. Alchichica 3B3-8F6 TaxID=2823696 RepID=UPI0020CD3706|nr:RdgB/HAM1 family non-canonical purine NTP pyrophosphatase [Cyanobium sp. Alchichica 3B3-8F6]MCP9881794.1 RdgB/HAM1 family non-canonical purine NTP pyrophosphatase [Cyanobium sp. Alchichica 3B3-8F6]